MKRRWIWILAVVWILAVAGFGVWTTGCLAGKPALEVSDTNGTERVFAVDQSRAFVAITNAFRLFRYHDMMLSDAVGSDYLAPNWHPTNGLILMPTVSTVAAIPTKGILGNRRLGYVATFCITCTTHATNETKVRVRTVTSKVLDGITLGHGGTVANTAAVQPVRREEENVLKAIEAEVALETTAGDHAGGHSD